MIDILNSVQKFTPTFLNVDNSSILASHANMIKTVDENNLIASQEFNKIKTALHSIDVADGDKHLIDEELQNITNVLSDNSTILGPGTAIDALTQYNIFDNKALKQAIVNQQLYRQAQSYIDNRQDLSNDQKIYFKNKIQYNGVTDEDAIKNNENYVVGYREWKNNIIPAEQIDNMKLYDSMIKIARADSRESSVTNFDIVKDANGNDQYVTTSSNSSGIEEITPEKLWLALGAAIDNFKGPSAYESLLQEYKYDCEMHPEVVNGQDYDGWLYDKFVGGVIASAYKRKKNIISQKPMKKPGVGGGSTSAPQKTNVSTPTATQGKIEVKSEDPTKAKNNAAAGAETVFND